MTTTPTTPITAGNTLKARSVCDSDCIFTCKIIARKGSFATIVVQGKEKRVKIHADDRGEFVFALGRYSMAPVFRA